MPPGIMLLMRNQPTRWSACMNRLLLYRIPSEVYGVFNSIMSRKVDKKYQQSMGECPLYGCNATDRLISWEIHYRPFAPSQAAFFSIPVVEN